MKIKNAIVAGTGKSGISAANLLTKHEVNVVLFDENEERDVQQVKEKLHNPELVDIELGKLSDKAYSEPLRGRMARLPQLHWLERSQRRTMTAL